MYRDEIAGCSEKAYDSLSLADAKKILMFASDQELQAYVLDVSISLSTCAKFFLHILFDPISASANLDSVTVSIQHLIFTDSLQAQLIRAGDRASCRIIRIGRSVVPEYTSRKPRSLHHARRFPLYS